MGVLLADRKKSSAGENCVWPHNPKVTLIQSPRASMAPAVGGIAPGGGLGLMEHTDDKGKLTSPAELESFL